MKILKIIFKTIFYILLAIIILSVVFAILMGMNPFKKSGYSNCAVADQNSAFIGEFLKSDGNATYSVNRTEVCVQLDQEHDDSNGARVGKIRWAECSAGPDCDEAGMF